jgi:hypothetical protein
MNGEDRLAAASEQPADKSSDGEVDWEAALAPSSDEAAEGKRKPSQATQLVQLAEDRYRLGREVGGDLFAVVKQGPPIVQMLRGSGTSLRAALADDFAKVHGVAPSTSALAGALLVLEGRARQLPPERLELRVAESDGRIVLDLGEESGRAVVVAPGDGWEIVTVPPVLFRRTALTAPLPLPEQGGNLDELRELVHVADEAWPLLVGWLLIACLPNVPAPILYFRGSQGAGKSSGARLVSRIVDPTGAQLRSAPRDPSEWVMSASGSRVVPLDNLSRIPEWLGDALCRAVTGEGLVRRQLYSDADAVVWSFRRAVMLTAITAEGVRGDLADRLLPIELERIPESRRRTEEELERAFAAIHPRMLGALLDLLAQVLRVLAEMPRLDRMPRLADAGRVYAALDRVLGTGTFDAFCGIAGRLAYEVVEDDLVASALVELLDRREGQWEGTAAALLETLTPDKPPKGWPTTVQAFTGRLTRAQEALRLIGVTLERTRVGKDRRRELTITRAKVEGGPSSASSPSSASAWLSENQRDKGVGQGADEPQSQADEGTPLVPTLVRPPRPPETGSTTAIATQADEADEVYPLTCEERDLARPPLATDVPAWALEEDGE